MAVILSYANALAQDKPTSAAHKPQARILARHRRTHICPRIARMQQLLFWTPVIVAGDSAAILRYPAAGSPDPAQVYRLFTISV